MYKWLYILNGYNLMSLEIVYTHETIITLYAINLSPLKVSPKTCDIRPILLNYIYCCVTQGTNHYHDRLVFYLLIYSASSP